MKLKNKNIALILAVFIFAGMSSFLLWDRSQLKAEIEQVRITSAEKQAARELAVISNVLASESVETQEQIIESKKNTYINEGKKFVYVDLETLELELHENGKAVKLNAKSKGREGTWWETPSGEYTILNKSRNSFSSLGGVWMPYSMQFYGNYLIHGWPYYPDGTDVASSYSGGCLRLDNETAKTVFDFVNVGTPVLIMGERNGENYLTLNVKNGAPVPAPEIAAESAIVANLMTGDVFMDKNSESVLPIASLSKLMTALVASEVINMDRSVRITSSMMRNSVQSYPLEAGTSYKIYDLLYPMLMQSSNGASEAIAAFPGRSNFISYMNKKADALGMTNTKFSDPSGVSEDNMSTAKELTFMARYIFEKRHFIYQISKGTNNLPWGYSSMGGIKNYNDFITDPDVYGGKVGMTDSSKETSLILLNLKNDKGEAPIVIIILNSPDRVKDGETLMNWVRSNFELSEL